MPNFVIWNDLHGEFRPFEIPHVSDFSAAPDAVLLAGDTDRFPGHLEKAVEIHEAYACPVVLVDGNHEFYHHDIDDVFRQEDLKLAQLHRQGYPIHLLRGDAVVIAGVRIVGATLWTDFELDAPFGFLSRKIGARGMNDYSLIRKSTGPGQSRLEPLDTIAMHMDEKHKLFEHLRMPFNGPTVAMTHHIPAKELIAPKYAGDNLNPAFASDLMAELRELPFDVWLFGHTHDSRELELTGEETFTGTRRFVSNPRGYPQETTRFDPLRMLHL